MNDVNIMNDSTKMPANVVQLSDPVQAPKHEIKRSYSRIYGKNEILDGDYRLS